MNHVPEILSIDEYAPFYSGYIHQIKTGTPLIKALLDSYSILTPFFQNLNEEKWEYKYAPSKWTIKEVLQHIIDTERIMSYRALCFARNDTTSLPGFEQDDYVPQSFANKRTASSLIEEYKTVRQATIALFESFQEDTVFRKGIANNNPLSVRAIAYIIAGHDLHHLQVLQERYM